MNEVKDGFLYTLGKNKIEIVVCELIKNLYKKKKHKIFKFYQDYKKYIEYISSLSDHQIKMALMNILLDHHKAKLETLSSDLPLKCQTYMRNVLMMYHRQGIAKIKSLDSLKSAV